MDNYIEMQNFISPPPKLVRDIGPKPVIKIPNTIKEIINDSMSNMDGQLRKKQRKS